MPSLQDIRVPPVADLGDDIKDVVLGSVKFVIKRLKKSGKIPAATKYRDLLADPAKMEEFIAAYKNDRSATHDLALDAAGKPARDDWTELVCGVTLAQIERLLVFTCFKRVYKKAGGKKDIPDIVKRAIAFDWQLPFLNLYAEKMPPAHYKLMEDNIFHARTAEEIEKIAQTSAGELTQALELTDKYFIAFLNAPEVTRNMLREKGSQEFDRIEILAGNQVFRFFGLDEQVMVEVLGLSDDHLSAFGPLVVSLSLESFRALEDMPVNVLAPFMRAFLDVFGEQAYDLLARDGFAGKFLKNHVVAFRDMDAGDEGEAEQVEKSAKIKWQSIKAAATEWLATP
jgi:sulfur carrier protein ThiS